MRKLFGRKTEARFILHVSGFSDRTHMYRSARLEKVTIAQTGEAKLVQRFNLRQNRYETLAIVARNWKTGKSVDIDSEVSQVALINAFRKIGYSATHFSKKRG